MLAMSNLNQLDDNHEPPTEGDPEENGNQVPGIGSEGDESTALVMSSLNQLEDNHEPSTELVPQDNSDYDPGIGSEDEESTTSLSSSVCEFSIFQGRSYHAFQSMKKYFAPNDESEQIRMELQYLAWMLVTKGKLSHVPAETFPRVLELGTGIGVWALEMGEEHREASIIAIDISPIQPSWVTSNVWFQLDDVENYWTFRSDYFDLIHSGQMLSGTIVNILRYFQQAFR